MDLLPYWNLRERPFEATWDTRFFYQGRDHDEALSRLTFLVSEETMNIGLLTGEIGCGKTLTRAVFTQRLDERRFTVVTQENSCFNFIDLLGAILNRLEGGSNGTGRTKFARFERLKQITQRARSEGKHLVLVFDEAQELTPATLNELKLLTNLNGEGRNYLSIILLGQPELRDRVARLPAIDQRISLRFHLKSLKESEAASYLKHRLQVAGHPTGELFLTEAVERAFGASAGIPRELNRLAKLALEYAWLREFPNVPLAAVDAVVRDLERHQKFPSA